MESIQDLSGEEKARFSFVLYFVNFGWKTQFCYVKRTELYLNSFQYILAGFQVSFCLCNKKANVC